MKNYHISDNMKNMKPSAIREIFKSLTDPTIISFAAGNPSPASFPSDDLARISADIYQKEAAAALQYGITEGYTPLREAVAARLQSKFGIGRDFDSTIIVTGGQQGIDLTCRVLCNPGDVVICENPSFIGALNAFRSNGAKLVGIDMEEDGLNVDKLEETLRTYPNVRMLYLIPTFQNPSGTCMSLEKRRQVYELARRYNTIILEDNPYGELRFSGEELPTFKSMDDDGIVVYCSSFSKILSAGMRVGFLCAPEAIMQKIVVAKQCSDVHTNLFFQMLCYRYMTECDMDTHVASIRELYRRKCALMLSELDKSMPDDVKYTRPEGGLFLWATLPDSVPLQAFVSRLIEKKVAVVPGVAFNCDEEAASSSFRMNYSTPSDEEIIKGVEILSEAAKEMLAK